MSKNFKPILFSSEMVKAILEGRKTQTRRTLKPQPGPNAEFCRYDVIGQPLFTDNTSVPAKWKVGDVLWVREEHYVWGEWRKKGLTKGGSQKWRFIKLSGYGLDEVHFADTIGDTEVNPNNFRGAGWYKRLARFMPKKYARIFLEITDIRVERIQDISEDDALAEGIEVLRGPIDDSPIFRNYLKHGIAYGYGYPKNSFRSLWAKINGQESWDRSDWVWAITFTRIDKPKSFTI